MKEYYGIDVSSNNGNLDWTKSPDFSFVIMRITQKYGIDSSFERNYEGVTKRGFKRGVYRFSYAKNAEESRKEANDVVTTLNGRTLEFPVFLDLEWKEQMSMTKSEMTGIINAFKSVIEKAGYKFAIYTGAYFYTNLIADEFKSKCDFWIASYPLNDTGEVVARLRPQYGVGWQYSSKKMINGFGGPFDANVFYKDYTDDKEVKNMGVSANDVVNLAKSWIGKKESDGSHRSIIDIYNSHKPLARGYKVKYTDQWCDTCVSALFVSLNAVDLIGGTECGVEEHVKLFKKAGIWIEDGMIKPETGDIIVFNWDDNTQPNDGYADHIGIVEKVSGSTITTIEGNYKDSVARRQLSIGHGNIRGYARPKYATASASKTEPVPVKNEEKTVTPAQVPVAKTYSIVKLNSYGDDVRVLQTLLNQSGYSLVVDGKFGMRTYSALTHYQNRHGLYVDGICGPKTWASLTSNITTSKKSVSEVAKEVIAGKWGNQPNRKKNLEAAGYDFDAVQKEVNKILSK